MKKLTFILALALIFNLPIVNIQQECQKGLQAQAKRYQAKIYSYNVRGQNLVEEGKLDQAQAYYSRLLRQNPRNLSARAGMASVYSAKFQLGAAEKEFKEILRINPKSPAGHNGMGLVYYRKTTSSNQNIRKQIPELYQKAIDEFKTALRYAPNYPEAYNNLGKIYQEQGKLQEAEEQYRKAIDLDSNYGSAIVNLGSIYYDKGEFDASIDQYRKAIKLNSKDSTAHYRMGEALTAQGNYDEAIKELQTTLYQNPNSAPAHDKIGEVYNLQGNEAAAITEFNKAITIKPEYTPAYLKLSDVYEQRGDDEFAVEKLRSAINVNPDFTEGKIKIADISNKIGKETQAIKMYQDVLNQEPENVEALKGISSAYFNKAKKDSIGGFIASPGDFVAAEQAIRRALVAQPNDLQLHLALLRLNQLTGNRQAAESELSMIVARPATTPAESIVKGEAFFALNRYKDGNVEFNKALNYTTKIKDVTLLGDIFAENGNLVLAKAAYQKGLTIDPNSIKSSKGLDRVKMLENNSRESYRAGFAFYKEGQRMAAIDDLRKASAINSVDPTTKWLLAEAFRKENFYLNAIDQYNAYLQLENPMTSGKNYNKAQKQVEKLTNKVNKMRANNEPIKDFDRYVQENRTKY